MSITYGDHLIDSGYYDITPEQEREIWAREECARRGIDPDEICADGGVEAWMVVAQEAMPVCPHECYRHGDCDGSCTHPAPVQPSPAMRETMWGEVVDDDYEGIAFRLTEEGNRDGHHFLKEIALAAETFPLGTKITVAEPVQQAAPSGEGE